MGEGLVAADGDESFDGDALAASVLGLVAGAWLRMAAGLDAGTAAAGGVVAEDEQATSAAAMTNASEATPVRRAG